MAIFGNNPRALKKAEACRQLLEMDAITMRDQGVSIERIAALIGVSAGATQKWLGELRMMQQSSALLPGEHSSAHDNPHPRSTD